MSEAGIEPVVQARTATDPDVVIRFGKFMGLRQWGNTPHMELFSDAPGNEGFRKIVIYEESYRDVADVFGQLARLAELRLGEATDGDVQTRKQPERTNKGTGRGDKGQSKGALAEK